jgi:hypothetical protein
VNKHPRAGNAEPIRKPASKSVTCWRWGTTFYNVTISMGKAFETGCQRVKVLFSSRQLWQFWPFVCCRVIILVAFDEWIHTKGEINHRHTSVTTQPNFNVSWSVVTVAICSRSDMTVFISASAIYSTPKETQNKPICYSDKRDYIVAISYYKRPRTSSIVCPRIFPETSYNLTGHPDLTASTDDSSYNLHVKAVPLLML